MGCGEGTANRGRRCHLRVRSASVAGKMCLRGGAGWGTKPPPKTKKKAKHQPGPRGHRQTKRNVLLPNEGKGGRPRDNREKLKGNKNKKKIAGARKGQYRERKSNGPGSCRTKQTTQCRGLQTRESASVWRNKEGTRPPYRPGCDENSALPLSSKTGNKQSRGGGATSRRRPRCIGRLYGDGE